MAVLQVERDLGAPKGVGQVFEVERVEKMTNSPSDSSLSSINSNSSTGKLIKSLSGIKVVSEAVGHGEDDAAAAVVEEEGETKVRVKIQTHSLPVPKNLGKKPIKFTVRKVSHELGQEKKLLHQKEARRDVSGGEKLKFEQQLKTAQLKYDQYASRIIKIDKEIDFLTKLLPPYNVEIDYVTRSKISRSIEKLRMKQEELDKKKYSLGITISRLWRDNSDTDIWVRSVRNL